MMARRTKDPDRELAELHKKRVGLATKRNEIDRAVGAAQGILTAAVDRRRAVLLAEARGEEHPETVEAVDLDRRQAEMVIAGGRERAEALQQVEREVGIDVDAVIDAYPDHFIEKALATSAATEDKRAALLDATAEVRRADRETQGAWSTVRTSRIRRGLDSSPEVHLSDLGGASSELAKSKGQAYPGGSREAWERFRAHEAAGKGERVSNAQAIAQFGGEAA
jgi:hypothetical protein